jgi:hypothetical protein
VCQVYEHEKIPCEKKTGGILVMEHSPVPHWKCVCTHSSFYGGKGCGERNPDVCENGTFLYKDQNTFLCFCRDDEEQVVVNGKPRCVTKAMSNFFKQTDGVDEKPKEG